MFEYIILAFAAGIAIFTVAVVGRNGNGITVDANGKRFKRVIERNEEGYVIKSEEVLLNPDPVAPQTTATTESPTQ